MGRINTTNQLTSSVNEIFVCTFHLGYPYFSPIRLLPVKGASKVLELPFILYLGKLQWLPLVLEAQRLCFRASFDNLIVRLLPMKAFQFCMVFIGLLAYVVALDLESSQQRQGGHPGPDSGQVFEDLFFCIVCCSVRVSQASLAAKSVG